ncbi:hypothetical protein PAXRUDRAFT_500715 [Paxillus rubicundulus Ve08.2h10]|uniref:Uncharacterized protein n=1 Tax=Paxillus rubicundulus Ve08.2h10 TaxID=930991 RepID=A0A0D0D5A6_9AGAM|nr:hypothetical protein PAXRUDRAFT_500715 [Paxillus rubicundulus Ve08.2h10]
MHTNHWTHTTPNNLGMVRYMCMPQSSGGHPPEEGSSLVASRALDDALSSLSPYFPNDRLSGQKQKKQKDPGDSGNTHESAETSDRVPVPVAGANDIECLASITCCRLSPIHPRSATSHWSRIRERRPAWIWWPRTATKYTCLTFVGGQKHWQLNILL